MKKQLRIPAPGIKRGNPRCRCFSPLTSSRKWESQDSALGLRAPPWRKRRCRESPDLHRRTHGHAPIEHQRRRPREPPPRWQLECAAWPGESSRHSAQPVGKSSSSALSTVQRATSAFPAWPARLREPPLCDIATISGFHQTSTRIVVPGRCAAVVQRPLP